MVPARLLAGASSVVAILALSGCSTPWTCTDTTAERGEAGARVRVEDLAGQPSHVTAEVVGWRLEPHPQLPAEGDRVHFDYRFEGADGGADEGAVGRSGLAVDACAVDDKRVALLCRTVHASETRHRPDGALTGDTWLAVEHPEQVAGAPLIPDDRSYGSQTCDDDLKDGGGKHPPKPAAVGDQL